MKKSIIELVRHYGSPRLIPAIEQNIKESPLLLTNQAPDDKNSLGRTKIGGRPDLPIHMVWPSWQNKSLSFIAQINLADLPEYDFLNILPSEGILSFFYSASQETWGFDPKDKGSWKVVYFEDHDIKRRDFPSDLPAMGRFESCSIKFQRSVSVPALDSPYINLKYGKSDWNVIHQYTELEKQVEKFLHEGNCRNRLLGHPDQIQNDMQVECQLVSHGLYCGDGRGYRNPKAKKLKGGALDWELLLQIDSDPNASMMWGDCGEIYYWIPRKELQERNFDAAWMILQCF